jgi:RNA polymerase sigma factor (sigma-70 family)
VDASTRADFERVFRDCHAAVHRYAARRVPADSVQDVVSETFLVAWRRFGDLRGEPLPWLLGIARRTAANQRRACARREALVQRLTVEPGGGQDQPPAGADRELLRALAALPERDREALMLVAWEGLGNAAAAAVMGCTKATFAVRLHRARRRLARSLEREGNGSVEIPTEASVLP